MNTSVASDGTLYVSVKTSGSPLILLLIRRPPTGVPGRGSWDNLYPVDTAGTRPIVLLNEPARKVEIVYTTSTSGGDIVMRESSLSPISFGSRRTLMTGNLNNATSTKGNWSDEVPIVAAGHGVLLVRSGGGTTSTTTTRPPTTTTRPPTTSTTVTGSTTTSTTIPGGGPVAVLEADTFVRASDPGVAFGSNALLEVDQSPVKHIFLRFRVSGLGSATVTSARLRLQVASSSSAHSDSGGRVHRTSCSWSESTLTWSTPPPPIDPVVLASAGAVALGQLVDFDVRAAITQGDGLYCFALDTTSSNGADYNSRSGAGNPPSLVLTASP
jgi:hypothetical protein